MYCIVLCIIIAICSILKCERMHASICRLRVISPTRTTIHIPVTALMTREEVIAEHVVRGNARKENWAVEDNGAVRPLALRNAPRRVIGYQ